MTDPAAPVPAPYFRIIDIKKGGIIGCLEHVAMACLPHKLVKVEYNCLSQFLAWTGITEYLLIHIMSNANCTFTVAQRYLSWPAFWTCIFLTPAYSHMRELKLIISLAVASASA